MSASPFQHQLTSGAPNRKGTGLNLYEKDMQGNNKHVGRGFSPDALEIPFIRNASGLKPRST